jgi:NAD(P)-dependent dehydrogenase (short-subunit alcohol dehydrogenase family)
MNQVGCDRRRRGDFRTGADSDIGRAVAIAYTRESADVLISYLNEHEDAKDALASVAND